MAEAGGRLLLSQAEYARRRGFSKQYVGQLVARGKLVLVDGMVDATAADQALAESHDPARHAVRRLEAPAPDPAAPGLQHSFAKARTIREHFRAMREKLEYEATTGAMLPRAVVATAVQEVGRIVRDTVMTAAEPAVAELARLVPELDADVAADIIQREIVAALGRAATLIESRSDPCNLAAAAGADPPATP